MNIQNELIAEYDREVVCTRKMLDAIPADADLSWKANPKSMTLGRLAGHTAETAGDWAGSTLSTKGINLAMAPNKPCSPATKAEILQKFDEDSSKAKQYLVDLDPA